MPERRSASLSVPPELRSASPSRIGVAWWMAIVIAVGFSALGFAFDAIRGDELTIVFSIFYFAGCVAAVLAVQQRSLFTAAVQPPLILFAGIPLAYQLLVPESPGGLRTRIIDLVLPLVTRFPLMLLTVAVVLIIAGFRIFAGRVGTAPSSQYSRRTVSTRRREGSAVPASGRRVTDAPTEPRPPQPGGSGTDQP
ncbi:hypothetical protein ONR57_17330 [Hoyosella sp. YIM 151337]|uniref:DUF6542 domain-containing protein n=1 Tax=Hoyosella sp. YIM 151337 TaxID=2992742 RepID=UPI002236724F|nr:DUF6542 domain-containing protein [Hoyosella sp. YIM 151337]MCW4355070.1 hypothetical protein [Hoyosella sp. YIM 151337]